MKAFDKLDITLTIFMLGVITTFVVVARDVVNSDRISYEARISKQKAMYEELINQTEALAEDAVAKAYVDGLYYNVKNGERK